MLDRLAVRYPEARIALDFRSPWELLVAVVLSAQARDTRVNLVTPALFARYPRVEALASAEPSALEPLLRPLGLFRTKARALVAAAREICARHRGRVPVRREELARLPGIGNKSAGVIAMHLGDEAALPVDTHVARVSFRLGLTSSRRPDEVERDLSELWPRERWRAAHHLLIWHGRRICLARGPRCRECPVLSLCPRRGLGPSR